MIIVYIIILVINGCIWGYATNAVLDGKGYDIEEESWFIWGFLFGIIPFLVAMSKPVCRSYDYSAPTHLTQSAYETTYRPTITDGWTCSKCKRTNASYVGTCACGNSQRALLPNNTSNNNSNTSSTTNTTTKNQKSTQTSSPISPADEILKYKKLLDEGAITQEEFDSKKKQLLEL